MNLLSLPESYIFTQLSFINNKFNEKQKKDKNKKYESWSYQHYMS